MKENTLELSFEMYEELKETLIKTLRTELAEARSQSTEAIDTDAIKQLQIRILQLYLIEILHQTTTSGLILIDKVLLTGCLPL